MKATVYGMSCREIIIFLALLYQPKKEHKFIGLWGQRMQTAIYQEHKRAVYTTLLTSGKLNGYLADIDEQAMDMMFRLVEQMADKEGVTEQLRSGKPDVVGCKNERDTGKGKRNNQ